MPDEANKPDHSQQEELPVQVLEHRKQMLGRSTTIFTVSAIAAWALTMAIILFGPEPSTASGDYKGGLLLFLAIACVLQSVALLRWLKLRSMRERVAWARARANLPPPDPPSHTAAWIGFAGSLVAAIATVAVALIGD